MKYIVGYPTAATGGFAETVLQYKEHIKEVYFSFGDLPNGRNTVAPDGELLFERQQRQIEDLKRLSRGGLQFNLLLNGNCYGKDSQSRAFFYKVGNIADYIRRTCGLSSVTTSSPLIAKFMRENFAGVDVRASVNMEIGTWEGMSYVKDCFDSFYVKRELNRNAAALRRLRAWCDDNGKEMYLLANSGCLNHCSAHTFHDNLVSHEAEIAAMDNGYAFKGVCWDFLAHPEHAAHWLERTNFIRPEDIALYEGLVPAVKLATRVNASPERVIRSYMGGRYVGSVMELLEPNHSGALYPHYIDNTRITADYTAHVLQCNKDCLRCDYCQTVQKNATVVLEDTTRQI